MAARSTPGRELVLETGRLLLRPWRVSEACMTYDPHGRSAALVGRAHVEYAVFLLTTVTGVGRGTYG